MRALGYIGREDAYEARYDYYLPSEKGSLLDGPESKEIGFEKDEAL